MAENYVLRISAGSDYDETDHVEVPVNISKPVIIKSGLADIELNVRVQDYRGLPRNSPTSSPYFDAEPHAYNQDQYSISFRFTPKAPSGDDAVVKEGGGEPKGISATNLQFGNDFDHPIRDRLPPGFNTAMSIVRWWIDPGLDGDAYADRPYLYGPALSSFNTIHVGAGELDEAKGGLWFEEGGDEEGIKARQEIGAPDTSKARMKWALSEDSKAKWVFEYGKTYGMDFFNPYLDFSNLALRLPGFHLPIMRYWDGQGLRSGQKRLHQLRYVLRNKQTEQTYLVVNFTLHPKEFVSEDGTIKPEARNAPTLAQLADQEAKDDVDEEQHDETEVFRAAKEQLSPESNGKKDKTKTSSDDVD